jgi:hypothetical protein
MHNFFEFALVILVAGWAFDRLVNAQIDKRMRATVAAPTTPKPPGLSMRERFTLAGLGLFLTGLFAVAGYFHLG